jgi:hypothetical protein
LLDGVATLSATGLSLPPPVVGAGPGSEASIALSSFADSTGPPVAFSAAPVGLMMVNLGA